MIARYAAFTILLFIFSGIAAAAPYPTTMPPVQGAVGQVHGVAHHQVHRARHRGHVAGVHHSVVAHSVKVAPPVSAAPSSSVEVKATDKKSATETLPIVNQRRVDEDHIEKSPESVQISTREPEMETVSAFAPKAFMWFGVLVFVYMVGKHGFGYVMQQVMAAGALVKADFAALEARVSQVEKQFVGAFGPVGVTGPTGPGGTVVPAPGNPPA